MAESAMLAQAAPGPEQTSTHLFRRLLSALCQRKNIEGKADEPKALTKQKYEISVDITDKTAQR